MKHSCGLTCVLLAFFGNAVLAQNEAKPQAGASAQGQGQAQTDVKAGKEGVAATGSGAGAASAEAGDSAASLDNGTEINATLSRPVDAEKAKPGDEVSAKAAQDIKSGGKVVVPRGSRLIGHVTKAQPRSKGSSSNGSGASELGIVFDRAVLKDGSEVALNGSVAAIAAAKSAASSSGSQMDSGMSAAGSMGGAGRGTAGGVGGAVSGAASAAGGITGGVSGVTGGVNGVTGSIGSAARSAGAVGGLNAAGALNSGSRGVFGLRDLDLVSSATGSAEGSVITSAKRNVRLESGTQMLVVASAGAAKPASKAAGSGETSERGADVDRR